MKSAKRFLGVLLLAYVVIGMGALAVLGGPGLSKPYREQHGRDHEHYLEIIKSDAYKLHQQAPKAHPADAQLQERLDFVEAYENRPEFQTEERRLARRDLFFDLLNVLTVAMIAVRFGRKPLLGFLDQQIEKVQGRIAKAKEDRETAARRRAEAEARLQAIEQDAAHIAEQAEQLAGQETQAIQDGTGLQLTQIDHETEQRKELEERRAAATVRRELVEQSIALVEQRLRAEGTGLREDALLNQFVRGLEGRS